MTNHCSTATTKPLSILGGALVLGMMTFLTALGLATTNLTILGRGVNPLPWLAALFHLAAVLTAVATWNRQRWFMRVASGFLSVLALSMFVGNLGDWMRT